MPAMFINASVGPRVKVGAKTTSENFLKAYSASYVKGYQRFSPLTPPDQVMKAFTAYKGTPSLQYSKLAKAAIGVDVGYGAANRVAKSIKEPMREAEQLARHAVAAMALKGKFPKGGLDSAAIKKLVDDIIDPTGTYGREFQGLEADAKIRAGTRVFSNPDGSRNWTRMIRTTLTVGAVGGVGYLGAHSLVSAGGWLLGTSLGTTLIALGASFSAALPAVPVAAAIVTGLSAMALGPALSFGIAALAAAVMVRKVMAKFRAVAPENEAVTKLMRATLEDSIRHTSETLVAQNVGPIEAKPPEKSLTEKSLETITIKTEEAITSLADEFKNTSTLDYSKISSMSNTIKNLTEIHAGVQEQLAELKKAQTLAAKQATKA